MTRKEWLQLQATALAGSPTYGGTVSLNIPFDEDPPAQIYLKSVESEERGGDRGLAVTATWAAVVKADPDAMSEAILDAEEEMRSALDDYECPLGKSAPGEWPERQPGADRVEALVTIRFPAD